MSKSLFHLLLAALLPFSFPACDQTGGATNPVCDAEMCEIPAGTFWMGCNQEIAFEYECETSEYPYHQVFLDSFMMDRTEVTYGEFMSCVDAGSCTHHMDDGTCYYITDLTEPLKQGHATPQYRQTHMPMVCVDWYQARQYCEWASKRLPTEAEWEKAARGTDGRRYPWGNDKWTCSLAVTMYDDDGWCGNSFAAEVCSKSPDGDSTYGMCDMAGNVNEWLADWADWEYYEHSPAENPQGPETGTGKSVRSGGICDDYHTIRTSTRMGAAPDKASLYRGFRCARDM